MLNIARTFAPFDVALVGINQGRLGFLTDISIDTMFETIGTILDGKYVTEERMLLEAEVFSGEQNACSTCSRSTMSVMSKGVKGSMIELEVRIDGQFLYTLRADGLIVATPDRFHRLCAVVGRADRASVAVGDGAGADVSAHVLEPADRDQQRQRGRNHHPQRRRRARPLRQPFAFRPARAATASWCAATATRYGCCTRSGTTTTTCCAKNCTGPSFINARMKA